jgi:broad specificity phosphatase PhoE
MKQRTSPGLVVLAAALMSVLPTVQVSAQQLVYLVRHAERADQGAPAGQMMAQTDPPLSIVGEARANQLAAMLRDAGITAVFASEYRRTQDTVKPLAARLRLEVQAHPARDTEGLVARLRSAPAAGVVLVAGHSNTLPDIIKALGGPEITIAEAEYDNIFIFVPATKALTRIRY